MTRWSLLVALLVGCSNDGDGADAGGAEVADSADSADDSGPDTGDDDDDATVDGDASADDDATVDGDATATESATDPTTDTETTDPSTDDTATDTGTGPMCGGFLWEAVMDVDPTTLDDNGDSISDWQFSGGAFPADALVDGVWQAAPDGYLRTLPDNPLSTRIIVHVRMRAVTVASRGAVFWANLGQEDNSVTRVWVEIALGPDENQVALVGGYSADGEPELLLDVPALGTDFIDVVLDADPATNEVTVAIEGMDHGTLELPSYDGSTPQAAAVGALEAEVEIDEVTFELCP